MKSGIKSILKTVLVTLVVILFSFTGAFLFAGCDNVNSTGGGDFLTLKIKPKR